MTYACGSSAIRCSVCDMLLSVPRPIYLFPCTKNRRSLKCRLIIHVKIYACARLSPTYLLLLMFRITSNPLYVSPPRCGGRHSAGNLAVTNLPGTADTADIVDIDHTCQPVSVAVSHSPGASTSAAACRRGGRRSVQKIHLS
jgi:hypothetical protein